MSKEDEIFKKRVFAVFKLLIHFSQNRISTFKHIPELVAYEQGQIKMFETYLEILDLF